MTLAADERAVICRECNGHLHSEERPEGAENARLVPCPYDCANARKGPCGTRAQQYTER